MELNKTTPKARILMQIVLAQVCTFFPNLLHITFMCKMQVNIIKLGLIFFV